VNAATVPVRVRRETHDKINEIIERVTRGGWQSVKAKRSDRVTVAAVLDEAVTRLLTKR